MSPNERATQASSVPATIGEQALAILSDIAVSLRMIAGREELARKAKADESAAIALLFTKCGTNMSAIARELGVKRTTLYESTEFATFRQLREQMLIQGVVGRRPRRGHKSKDGTVEAYDEPSE